ncbi:hypothetical protein Lupro_03205 [Lutibacter profundi]|uniref:Uncharacterized protein n=1 Tax=Lutibacter profundi TaxID=1622118 RepID=A0A0X8G5C4_9FLAO|nr:hypothetical protein [Lutibacter profundi]AMC10320.1 hypothetical protein Lupro_03205 [Lutibacter profundi]
MELKKTLIATIILSIIAITTWELYWRSQGLHPTLSDEKALWAKERAKLENATKNDIVLIGASRTYFDIQKKVWEKETGIKAIQLSSTGSTPLPAFRDIVENTNYNGTLIVGITPAVFFSTTYPKAPPWHRIQSKVDYYFDMTYAQKANYFLSVPLQENLVLMSADEEEWADDIDLKSLLRRVDLGKRTEKIKMPPFYNFGDVSLDRNIAMSKRAATDTAFANSIIRVWHFFGRTSPPPDKDTATAFFMKDVEKFIARGGNLILIRPPSSGGTRMAENKFFSRERFWDSLVGLTKVKSYHFEDYTQLKNLTCPEESHLSKEDADYFTKELAGILMQKKAITNIKTN